MKIKPHDQFKYVRADEVAECWPGVTKELYAALWSKVVPHQKEIPNIEDSGPGDHVGHANLAGHWKRLTEEEQATLNKIAEEVAASYSL